MKMSFWLKLSFQKQFLYLSVGTLIGIIAQYCCYYYIRNNPELLKKYQEKIEKRHYRNNQTNPNNTIVNNFRGSEIISVSTIIGQVLITTAIEGGVISLVTSFLTWCAREKELESVIFRATINNYLPSKAFILSDKSLVSEITGTEIQFLCSNALQYLYYVLTSPLIPFEEKKRKLIEFFSTYLNREQMISNQRIILLMCIIAILSGLALSHPESYFLLLQQILNSFKEGKLPKWLLRGILRLLKKKSYPIDPELISTVDKINAIVESVDK